MKTMTMTFGQPVENSLEVVHVLIGLGCEWQLVSHTQTERPKWYSPEQYFFPSHTYEYELRVPTDKAIAILPRHLLQRRLASISHTCNLPID